MEIPHNKFYIIEKYHFVPKYNNSYPTTNIQNYFELYTNYPTRSHNINYQTNTYIIIKNCIIFANVKHHWNG